MVGRAERKRLQQGFTLVETMLALMIFAIAALAALNVATEQLRSSHILETRYLAQQVASNRLAELHVEVRNGAWPPQNEQTGSAELAGVTWFWQQAVVETVTPDLQEVTVQIRDEESGPIIVELSAFVGRR